MKLKKKSFLTEAQFSEAKASYLKNLAGIDLKYESLLALRSATSLKLEVYLLKNINEVYPAWHEAGPLLQGSWSRLDLCPYSDLDILFLGDEEEVRKASEALRAHQFKLMHRVPQNYSDWTDGVEPYDVFAYFYARSLATNEPISKKLLSQKKRAVEFLNREKIKDQLIQEKKERAKRYETVVNYLEPNLKYSPGGLKDIQQSLDLLLLVEEDYSDYKKKLLYFKELFLLTRQFLHFNSYGDVLVADAQHELFALFGMESLQQLMQKIHTALNESFFISQLIVDEIFLNDKKVNAGQKKINTIEEAIKRIQGDSSLGSQYYVRKSLESLKPKKENYSLLSEVLKIEAPIHLMSAFFNSEVLHFIEPELHRVKGWVQHDQYHKYCLDQHILNTLCASIRAKADFKGKVSGVISLLTAKDWDIIMFTALYHDIGKGRPGAHSDVGAQYFLEKSEYMQLSEEVIEEVQWMVQNHLLVSKLAFKRNPSSPESLSEIIENELTKERFNRLLVFTVIDIIATNPEAWDGWKDEALYALWANFNKEDEGSLKKILESLSLEDRSLFKELMPQSMSGVSADWVLKDLKLIKNSQAKEIALFKNEGSLWIRFYYETDEKGVALKAIKKIYALGVSVLRASFKSVNHPQGSFVYDWFLVDGGQSQEQILNKLKHLDESKIKIPAIDFDSVKLIGQNKDVSTISFKGKDQSGALLCAVNSIYKAHLDIIHAQVNTWGERVDDVFTVKTEPYLADFLNTFLEKS